ncbi:MAG: hypothetical protein KIS81_11325 [Maricaulaceae bacterium]|nr:hypothetical protein [Maricaulaceae bacterium]
MIRLMFLAMIAVSLSACGLQRRDPIPPGADGGYSRAASMAAQGRYEEALPALRCAADQGQGYEVAQHQTALALFALADRGGAEAGAWRDEAMERLTLAANAGWGASQAELARRNLAAGEAEDAAYWAIIYRANARESSLGVNRLGADSEAAIRAAAGQAGMERARARAGEFFPRPQSVRPLAHGCANILGIGNQGARPPRQRQQQQVPPGGPRY